MKIYKELTAVDDRCNWCNKPIKTGRMIYTNDLAYVGCTEQCIRELMMEEQKNDDIEYEKWRRFYDDIRGW